MIEVEIITPNEVIDRQEVRMVVVPAAEGDIGVMENHVPLSTALRPGLVKLYKQEDKAFSRLFVAKGFVNIQPKHCTILAEYVDLAWDKTDKHHIEKKIEHLLSDLDTPKETDDISKMQEDLAILKAHHLMLETYTHILV